MALSRLWAAGVKAHSGGGAGPAAHRQLPEAHVVLDVPVRGFGDMAASAIWPRRLRLSAARPSPGRLARLAAARQCRRCGRRVIYTLTRSQPPGWTGYSGRVNAAMLAQTRLAGQHPLAFVCGPTSFVETVAQNLIGLGYPPGRVKTERFGGT